MSGLEIRKESQEQYSRSLKLHNIQVLVDERGSIVHPVDIEKLILQVFLILYDKNLKVT
jgi:hypothetical protein